MVGRWGNAIRNTKGMLPNEEQELIVVELFDVILGDQLLKLFH